MIGVIADDLTGAAELGAVGWRHGLRSEITGITPCSTDADLVCINTDSRSLSPRDAEILAAQAADVLRQGGAHWIYKKVDSVLRGHVVAETRAIVSRIGRQCALIVAANPGRGRVIRGGEYLIAGQPIDETEFGRDPEYPRGSSKVMELVDNPGDGSVCVCGPRTPLPLHGIVLGEAESAGDLAIWADRWSPSILPGGGAEFFEALLRLVAQSSGVRVAKNTLESPMGAQLFVCGTRSDAAGRFLETAKALGVPVFSWPEAGPIQLQVDEGRAKQRSHRVAEALRTHSRVVLTAYYSTGSGAGGADAIARQLSRFAFTVLQLSGVSDVYVEGGATASLLLHELGWAQLRVVGEWAPGVVTLQPSAAPGVRVTLKPGSYLWPEAIQRGGFGVGTTALHAHSSAESTKIRKP